MWIHFLCCFHASYCSGDDPLQAWQCCFKQCRCRYTVSPAAPAVLPVRCDIWRSDGACKLHTGCREAHVAKHIHMLHPTVYVRAFKCLHVSKFQQKRALNPARLCLCIALYMVRCAVHLAWVLESQLPCGVSMNE